MIGRPATRRAIVTSEPRHLISIDDLSVDEIGGMLKAARRFARAGRAMSTTTPFAVGLLFLSSSLRTRIGFAVATARLGGTSFDVVEQRWRPGISAPESFEDTLRTLAGMVDVVVCRTPFRLDRELVRARSVCPLVNAGDGAGDHPTQALIDLFAIEEERGPVGGLRVGICGDIDGRAARSLIRLLDRIPPRSLTLFAPPGRDDPGLSLGRRLQERIQRRSDADFRDLDVLYMAGLTERSGDERLDARARSCFALTDARLRALPDDSVVLSPLPVTDEITATARRDPRVRVFEQSDRGVHVRMAVLEMILGRGRPERQAPGTAIRDVHPRVGPVGQ